MITAAGKIYIKRYLSGQVPLIGRSIALGVGSTTPTTADNRLEFEVARSEVISISYNFVTDKLIFKANVPDALAAVVYEIGLYSQLSNVAAGQSDDRMLLTFDSASEVWSGTPTWSTTNTRIGEDSLRQAPAAGTTLSNEVAELSYDLSAFSGADTILIAYNNASTNTGSVSVKFKTDDSNYYTYSVTNPTAGYHIDKPLKSAMVATGTPNWASIEKIEVSTTSKSGLVGTVDWEAIKIADNDTDNPDYVLVAREIASPSFTVVGGSVNEVEISLPITV